MGIVEQGKAWITSDITNDIFITAGLGKEIKERVTMRRSFYTSPKEDGLTDWDSPQNEPGNRGWGSFLTHDLLFYKEWNYVYEDTMEFSFRLH